MSDVAEFPDVAVVTPCSSGPQRGRLSTLVTDLLQQCHPLRSCSILVKRKVEASTGGSRIGRQLQRLALACAAFTVTSCIVSAPKDHADRVSVAVRAAEQP